MTTISMIPNNGYKTGTCGWLAKGLHEGSIKIAPGKTTTGKGALWIMCDNKCYCLAIFNEFDIEELCYRKFTTCCEDFAGVLPLTKSADKYLRAAADEWCENANNDRELDGIDSLPVLSFGAVMEIHST